MKRKLILSVFSIFITTMYAFGQSDFPYAKMLDMTESELIEAKFKFDSHKNCYVLNKSNGLQKTANVLSALNGTSADIKPHIDDYIIVIQNGDSGIASVTVLFYKPDTYNELLIFANDKGNDYIEINSAILNNIKFNYNEYSFELNSKLNGVSTTGRTSTALAKTIDESYYSYSYVIYTGKEANSDYIKKEKKKQAKRDAKGKKQKDASSFM